MTFRISLLLILITGFVLSCSTGPEFERDNMNDPESDTFLPNPPKGQNYNFQSDSSIILTWNDNTDFEEGYRVYKSLGNDSTFKKLEDLPIDSESFHDTSKKYSFPTVYKIVSIKDDAESPPLIITINFGYIESLKASKINDKVLLEWNNNVRFNHGFLIQRSVDDSKSINQKINIDNNTESLLLEAVQDGFVHTYSIKPFNIFENDTSYLTSTIVDINLLGPSDLKVNFLTEDSLKISWTDNSEFEDGYRLLDSRDNSEIAVINKSSQSYIWNNDFKYNENYSFVLQAFKDDVKSPLIANSIVAKFPKPSITSLVTNNESSVTLKISDPSSLNRKMAIYRSENNSEVFSFIGEVPKGDSFFEDPILFKSKIYTYSIRTILSEKSDEKSIHFTTSLSLLDKINNEFSTGFNFDHIAFTAFDDKFAYISFENERLLNIYDYNQKELTQSINVEYGIRNIAFNDLGTKIAGFSLDMTKIYSIDLATEQVDTLSFLNTRFEDLEFISSNYLVAIVHETENISKLILINLNDKTTDVVKSFETNSESPQIFIDQSKTKLVFRYETDLEEFNGIRAIFYEIQEDDLLFINEKTINNYPISFSATLDSMITRSNDQYQLNIIDLNLNTTVFSDSYGMYNSNFFRYTTLLSSGTFYVQDQYGSFLVDTKLNENQIVQVLGFCCDHSAKGVLWDKNDNLLIDFRSSHTSGVHSFFSIYKISPAWSIIIDQ